LPDSIFGEKSNASHHFVRREAFIKMNASLREESRPPCKLERQDTLPAFVLGEIGKTRVILGSGLNAPVVNPTNERVISHAE
jgi:hypothetical protein